MYWLLHAAVKFNMWLHSVTMPLRGPQQLSAAIAVCAHKTAADNAAMISARRIVTQIPES